MEGIGGGSPLRSTPATLPRGILTLAYGRRRYQSDALALVRSIRRYDKEVCIALASDAPMPALAKSVDLVVPIRPGVRGFEQKLYLDSLTPFDETLFFDADMLCFRAPTPIFTLFEQSDFGVVGLNSPPPAHFFPYLDRIPVEWHTPLVPNFNGGMYFFRRNDIAAQVFERARYVWQHYDEWGLGRVNARSPADEPCFSLALASLGIPGIDDGEPTMRTPTGTKGPIEVDVLDGTASFVKYGTRVQPSIVHFAGSFRGIPEYRAQKQMLALSKWLPESVARRAAKLDSVLFKGAKGLRKLLRRIRPG